MQPGGSIVGLTFDATVGLAGVRLDGRGQGRPGVDAPATSPATSGRRASGCNLVSAGPLKTLAAKAIPGFEELESMWKDRAPLGWDETDHDADRAGRRARCYRTSSRRPPARSCTSTAASTRWAPDPLSRSVRA